MSFIVGVKMLTFVLALKFVLLAHLNRSNHVKQTNNVNTFQKDFNCVLYIMLKVVDFNKLKATDEK